MSDICVVLGNGPSLKGFDFRRLDDVATLGMNAAYRYWDEIDWYPTYYACLDDQLIISHHAEIHRLWQEGRIKRFFVHGSFFDRHPECICATEFVSLDQVLPHWYRKRGRKQGWRDLTQHPAFRTSDTSKVTTGAFATRFAAYMGHATLALMGIDLKYVEILPEAEKTEGVGLMMKETPKENPNYFFDSYQQAGDKYNIPNPDVHENRLHIESFRLVREDFKTFGQRTEIFNTNPGSLLEDEQVFPLRLISRLLIPHDMAAIVVPSTQFEIDALLANLDIWNTPAYAPLSMTDLDNRCALVFMFNNRQSEQYETVIRQKFADTGMERYFSYLGFEYLDLEGEDDLYVRSYKEKVGAQGYKAGPNNQFFGTMRRARDLGRYAFQMETDCVPLCRGWLSRLRKLVAGSEPFWIMGSRYHGVETLSPAFENHNNGNAIYAVGDPDFQAFLDGFWEPRTRAMVAEVDRRLAYDCILEKVFTEQAESDPEVRRVLEEHDDKFRATEHVLNISGKRDLEELSPSYQTDLLQKFPEACVLHNRTAQKWVAAEVGTTQYNSSSEAHLQPIDHPRLLVLDMTAMGNGTATGEVKSNLLRDWPSDRLMQVAAPGPNRLSLVRRDGKTYPAHEGSAEDMRAAIAAFDPEVILYRPLADMPHMHDFAMSVIEARDVPLVTWIMDDWPSRLYAEDRIRFAPLDRDLRRLLDRSALRLSICDAMSKAFSRRYGVPFSAYANGIDAEDWPEGKRHAAGPMVVRYAGGLAHDMNAESVQRVARAVEELAAGGMDIRLEINTQPWWLEQSGSLFEGLSATRLEARRMAFAEYVEWLRDADVLLIAYNFDHASLRYVQYSMANKTPECLASGAAILAHGPRGVATVDYLAEIGTAQIADRPDAGRLREALSALADPETRQTLADAGRKRALAHHTLPDLAESLARRLERIRVLRPSTEFAAHLYSGDAPQPDRLTDPERIRASLADGARGIVIYDDPAAMMSAEMKTGGDPSKALAAWSAQAQVFLALCREGRTRLTVIERSRLLVAPKAMRAMLRDLFPGRHLPGDVRFNVAPTVPLLYTMADLFLRQNRSAQRSLAELRAASLRPDGVPSHEAPDLASALEQYHTLSGISGESEMKEKELARALAEISALRASLIAEQQLLKDEQARRSTSQEQDSKALALQEAQIVQLQATVETYFKEAETLRAQLQDMEKRIAEERELHLSLREELDRIYESKSWRVTEPMRGIRRALGAGPRME